MKTIDLFKKTWQEPHCRVPFFAVAAVFAKSAWLFPARESEKAEERE